MWQYHFPSICMSYSVEMDLQGNNIDQWYLTYNGSQRHQDQDQSNPPYYQFNWHNYLSHEKKFVRTDYKEQKISDHKIFHFFCKRQTLFLPSGPLRTNDVIEWCLSPKPSLASVIVPFFAFYFLLGEETATVFPRNILPFWIRNFGTKFMSCALRH